MNKVFALAFLVTFLSFHAVSQTYNDTALRSVVEKDSASRNVLGKLQTLTAAEHIYRADVYSANRQFPQAREHWQVVLDQFPADVGTPKALFGIGRSYMWEREYARAVPYFDRVSRDFPLTKDGREGLAFKGSCHVQLGKNLEAAKIYAQYTVMYPTGEKIESAYLNLIDANRESGKYDEADQWVQKTVQRFAGTPTQINALHARLRMEIFRQNWTEAVLASNDLLALGTFSGSLAGSDEVKFLKGFALEKSGRRSEARAVLSSIPDNMRSYFGSLAGDRLDAAGGRIKLTSQINRSDYPLLYRSEILNSAKPRNIDPRFILAVMNQESTFKPGAKSPSAARGLLQLTIDTALKYNKKAGFPSLKPADLYEPRTNIAIGCEYIADLRDQFGGLYEAIAASYNGGEDNVARWLNRSKPKEPGIFVSEIGFAETKNYVLKVMRNYRAYRELYDENLLKR